jgi:hypothetical protein
MVNKNPLIKANIKITFLQHNKRERVFQICFKFKLITSPNRKRLHIATSRNEVPYVKRATHPAERLGERHIKDAQNKMPLITASIEIAAPPSVVREKAR